MPGRSRRRAVSSRDSANKKAPPVNATAATGKLTKNTAFQENCSISQPPTTGPIPIPNPKTAAQIAIALARSCVGKVALMIESVEGMISDPPIPRKARDPISIRVVFEKPADADPIANIIKPTCNARLRPNRSPSDPIVSNKAANIRT